MNALAEITGDRPAATKLRRMHALPPEMVNDASELADEAATEAAIRRKDAITGTSRERRSSDAARITRTAGISRTHLLTLAGVQDRRKRDQLFRDSIKQGWSSAELKQQARGSSKKQRPLRPSELTYTTVVKADEFLELLVLVAEDDMLAATKKVKPTELARTIGQCADAIEKLKELKDRIEPTIDMLTKAKERLKKHSS